MAFLRYSVIALRVLAWVLVASLAVFAIATAFGIAYERNKALSHAHFNAQEVVEQSLPAISVALWQYDVAGLNALMGGMVASTVVVRVELHSIDKLVADVSQPGFTGPIDHVWTVPVMALDQRTSIGSLRVSESYAKANAQVTDTLKTLVLTDLIKIVGLALVLFAIVYRKVARPERKQSDEAQRIAATAFESQQGVFITNAQHLILRVNKAFTEITGYSADEVAGQSPSILKSGRHDGAFFASMTQALQHAGTWAGEIWNRRKNGEIYPEWLNISAVKDLLARPPTMWPSSATSPSACMPRRKSTHWPFTTR
jgi:PAS domain S-box-containing protein